MNLAPILLFVYRKPDETEKVLQALARNPLSEDSILYIYADGPKPAADKIILEDIDMTRNVIKKKKWTKEVFIIESDINKGLASSVMAGVTEVVNKHGKVIVLDDDMCVAKGFLKYMNDALDRYEKEDKIMQISGYVFPFVKKIRPKHKAYFIPFAASPAWATWKRAWDKLDTDHKSIEQLRGDPVLAERFDLHGTYPFTHAMLENVLKKKVDSWAGYWWWTVFSNNGLVLSPDQSLAQYLSSGDKATHVKGDKIPFSHAAFDPDYFIDHYPSDFSVDYNYFENVKLALKRTRVKLFPPSSQVSILQSMKNSLSRNVGKLRS